MKSFINKRTGLRVFTSFLVICLLVFSSSGFAQDSAAIEETPAPVKVKPVKNTFESAWIIDNQTVMVPIKGTMEMDIQHRFSTVSNGTKDLWGLLGSSANIRLGMTYSPINKLNLGIGITKEKMLLDLSLKYSIITQTPGKYPVSITYFGDAADDTRKDATIFDGSDIKHNTDRYSFFNEIIIARKISDRLSVQIAPSLSHQNAVPGYYTKIDTASGKGTIFKYMKNDHFAVALAARFKLTDVTSLMIDYDQPITKHPSNNPNPNLSFGFEFNTGGHSFQVFFTNFSLLSPQQNNLYNKNNPFEYKDKVTNTWVKGGQFMIGFNITRLWNY
ncbi:MAG: hypothetical protein KGM16_07860 [Bacteroidota bacterium]|nr:hypothetical protein [Bacteroidota bacterium]